VSLLLDWPLLLPGQDTGKRNVAKLSRRRYRFLAAIQEMGTVVVPTPFPGPRNLLSLSC
jgi:hypothetical protein